MTRSASPQPRLHRALRLASLLSAILAITASAGCDARAREIRARLSSEQQTLFDRGRQVSAPCWACHDFYGTQHKIGPHLGGLFGRRAGGSSFGAYSEALLATGAVWDRRTLDAFLASPTGFAPGTTMAAPGVASSGDRAALLFYMEQVTRPGAETAR